MLEYFNVVFIHITGNLNGANPESPGESSKGSMTKKSVTFSPVEGKILSQKLDQI